MGTGSGSAGAQDTVAMAKANTICNGLNGSLIFNNNENVAQRRDNFEGKLKDIIRILSDIRNAKTH